MELGGKVVIATMLVWWVALTYYQIRTEDLGLFQFIMLALAALPLGVVVGTLFTISRVLLRWLTNGFAALLLRMNGAPAPGDTLD